MEEQFVKGIYNQNEVTVRALDKSEGPELILDSASYDIQELNNETLKITKLFVFNNVPAIEVSTVFPSEITRNGIDGIHYGLTTIFVVGLFSILIIWALLKFCVITPIIDNRIQRASDMAARYGGEEFILIMPGHSFDSARVMAKKILNAFAQEKTSTYS